MSATKLGLYELLAPQFLAGFTFPPHVDRYLAFLSVEELRTSFDDSGVVYSGRVSFGGDGEAAPQREHQSPDGGLLRWDDVFVDFRLTIPRDGAAVINTATQDITALLPEFSDLFEQFGPVEQAVAVATEFPGIRFRLELLLSALVFHLPKDKWVPGEVGSDFKIRPSTDPDHAGQDVKFVLPKVVLVYEQGDDLTVQPTFSLASWGSGGFDAPHDLKQGELVRMEPPIALHESERFAFGVDQILLDLSEDNTPPEILEFFGTDEAFQGLYIRSARIYYLDEGKDFGFNIGVNDLLISLTGEVSMEAFAHIFANTPLTVFDVKVRFYTGENEIDYTLGETEHDFRSITITGSRARVTQTSLAQLDISGGVPQYTISVTINAEEVWNGDRRDARVSPDMPDTLRDVGDYEMVVHVTDEASPGDHHEFTQTIRLEVVAAETDTPEDPDGSELDRPQPEGARQAATLTLDPATPLPSGGNIRLQAASQTETERLFIEGGTNPQVVIRNGATVVVDRNLNGDRGISVLCPHGESLDIEVTYPGSASSTPERFLLFFDYDKPKKALWRGVLANYRNDSVSDSRFHQSTPPFGGAATPSRGAANLKRWIQSRLGAGAQVTITSKASAEGDTAYNQALSVRRQEVAEAIIADAAATVASGGGATGETDVNQAATTEAERNLDRVSIIEGRVGAAEPATTVRATLTRPPRPDPVGGGGGGGADPHPVIHPSGRPPDIPTRRPPFLRRLSFRIRLERNVLVLLEISGEVDFETQTEERLRNAGVSTGSLAMKQLPAAVEGNENPADGVVEFKLLVTYDTSTKALAETLYLGASTEDKDGLLRTTIEADDNLDDKRIRNIAGALLTLAPVINSAAASLDAGSAGDWAALAVSLAVPIAIGGIEFDGVFIFQTQSITLFGGELRFRQLLPQGEDPLRFTDAGVIFDYGVEFKIEIPQLGIHTERNLKVRYRAVGFNLHFEDGVTYQPIFDTSRGYEIDLGDPGLFNIEGPLGNIIKIFGVRLARFNPLTLELDLGLKVDLGIVTVDRFKVKWPLHDPFGPPSILPSGVKINIPATLIGEGRVVIVDQVVDGVPQKGILGSLDVTIVPTKLRVAASLGVVAREDLETRRKAIAIFAGLIVEFPTPIPLWSTGVGLYGFSGLFAMHFKRTEPDPIPGDSIAPALHWLVKAEGEPARLFNSDGLELWETDFDHWSFGIGLILGTVEGGFLVNFRGMFVLELPGPRILIFVKVQVVKVLPNPGDGDLTVGILGVIDLDFNLGTFTIGILVDLTLEDIVQLRIPVEVFFKFDNIRNWHLYIGTITAPASAKVLNLVQARGYFMIDGNEIAPFPPAIAGNPAGPGLPGIAVAVGIDASIVFGSTDIGLYLRVAAGAHLGVAFGGSLFVTGLIYLEGELRLFIISIGATGSLTVEAPDPTLIHGEICGKVSFFFFSVKGCVGVSIGSGSHTRNAPSLVNGVFLQSHAPVIAAGQGGERPIDGSLGNAIDALNNPADENLPKVPIDSLPVIQFFCAPRINDGTSTTLTFTRPLTTAPNLPVDGWVSLGGDTRVRYFLQNIQLDQGFLVPSGVADPKPPATWRRDVPPGPQGANSNVDLALFSNVPVTGERALERSTDVDEAVRLRWENLCRPIAPPVCTVWTFCRQTFGPSGEGWKLTGIPAPDPPGTIRYSPPPTQLQVDEPAISAADEQLNLITAAALNKYEDPARIIGHVGPASVDDSRTCVDFGELKPGVLQLAFMSSGMRFSARQMRITKIENTTGLAFRGSLTISIPEGALEVEIEAVPAVKVPAIPSVGVGIQIKLFRRVTLVESINRRIVDKETFRLRARGVDRITITAPEILILRLCFTTRSEQLNSDCFRALQLPRLQAQVEKSDVQLPRAFLETRLTNRWIELETGLAHQVRLLVAITRGFRDRVFLVQVGSNGSTVEETNIAVLSPALITGVTTNLPDVWLSPPWKGAVLPVATLLAEPEFGSMERLLVTLRPSKKMVRLRIEVRGTEAKDERVIVGVVEICPKAESERAEHDQAIQSGEIETVTGYLSESSPVPLLLPNKKYKLTVRYNAEIEGQTPVPQAQEFLFRTDEQPPARLDSRVLATTPNTDEQFHFYEDPVKIVFNDLCTIQLYQAYGKSLMVRLRAADGVPLPEDELTVVDPVSSGISTPYREAIEQMVNAGLLPCSGELQLSSHGSYQVPIPLRPLMAYTLDVEMDPPPPATPDATTPLFRRQFRTGRFATPEELVADLRERRIRHRALNGAIAGLPAGAPLTTGGTPVGVSTDIELQNALTAAGEEPLAAPPISGITIYWIPKAGGGFAPHAILLDAAEPLWRTRFEPTLETVPLQQAPVDPNFQRAVLKDTLAMEVIDVSATLPSAKIQRFVRSASGTRTLCFLKPSLLIPASGANLQLSLHRPASALFALPNQTFRIMDFVLMPSAPWENDHE